MLGGAPESGTLPHYTTATPMLSTPVTQNHGFVNGL
jgi:hypothetical protein